MAGQFSKQMVLTAPPTGIHPLLALALILIVLGPIRADAQIGRGTAELVGGQNDTSNSTTNAVVRVGGCTGTLIAPRIVVTAGHCISHRPPVEGLPATNDGGSDFELPGVWYPLFDASSGIRIRFGNDSTSWIGTFRAFHYNHPGFADVVMLGLSRPVPDTMARPAPVLTQIPGGADPAAFWREKRFEMVGWGFTNGCGGPVSPRFRQRANGVFGAWPHEAFGVVQRNWIYIKGGNGESVARGDSGGPLFWKSGGQRYLVGTVQGCEPQGGRYFGTWGQGGRDSTGKRRPDLSAWYRQVLRQGIDWEALTDVPSNIRDVAICFDGRVTVLREDGELRESRNWGDGPWRRVGRLPADAVRISCGAGLLYFQKENREVWKKDGTAAASRIGRPWAAATVSGSEDSTLDFPHLWALNDDRSLWINTQGGIDNKWRRVGRPWAAREIAAAQTGIFALNGDGSLWWNTRRGADGQWKRVGEAPRPFTDIAAEASGQSDNVFIIGVTADSQLYRGALRKGGGAIPAPVASGDTRTFALPVYGRDRLDWCFGWGDRCGAPAAGAFCKLNGFDRATSFSQDRDIGARSATYVLGAGRRCTDTGCDGFSRITCRKD